MRLLLSIIVLLVSTTAFGQQPKLILPTGHTDEILSYAVTKDERFLITGSRDNSAKVWNYKTGKLLHDLTAHTGQIVSVLIKGDDRYVVLASGDGTYSKWEIASGKLIFRSEPMAGIEEAFLIDNDSLILLVKQNVVAVGDFNGNEYSIAETNEYYPNDKKIFATIRPDKQILALLQPYGTLEVFDLAEKKLIGSTDQVEIDPTRYYRMSDLTGSVSFIGDDKIFADFGRMFVLFDYSGRQLNFIHQRSSGQRIWNDTKTAFAFKGFRDDSLRIFRLDSFKVVNRFPNPKSSSPYRLDSTKVYSLSQDGIDVWSVVTGKQERQPASDQSATINSGLKTDYRLIKTGNKLEKKNSGTSRTEHVFEGKIPPLYSISTHGKWAFEIKKEYANLWDLRTMQPQRLPKFNGGTVKNVFPSASPDMILLQYDDALTLYNIRLRTVVTSTAARYNLKIRMLHGDSTFLATSEKTILHYTTGDLSVIDEWKVPYNIRQWTLSSDERFIAFNFNAGPQKDSIYVLDLTKQKRPITVPRRAEYVRPGFVTVYTPRYTPAIQFSKDNAYLFFSSGDRGWISIAQLSEPGDIEEDDEIKVAPIIYDEGSLQFFTRSRPIAEIVAEKIILLTKDNHNGTGCILALNYENLTEEFTLEYPEFQTIIHLDPKNQVLITATVNDVLTWDLKRQTIVEKKRIPNGMYAHSYDTISKSVVLESYAGFGLAPDGDKPGYLFYTLYDNEKVIYRTDGYYMADPAASRYFSWNIGDRFYDFDQWDLQYNRPDLLMELSGDAGKDLAKAYFTAYKKRIGRKKSTKGYVEGESPVITILNREADGDKVISREFNLDLKIETNKKSNPQSVIITVNGNPILSANGQPVSTKGITIPIVLSQGLNQIRVSAIDDKGGESLKEQRTIVYESSSKELQKTYFIGVGIDHYQDKSKDLSWCVKDIRDLSRDLSKNAIGQFIVDTLFNENATRPAILALKEKLKLLDVDDKVIIAYSGHGLFGENFDYFLSTYNADFSKPEREALSYEAFESLLENVPARQKLILLDACHSGEVDKEDLERFTWNEASGSDSVRSGRKPQLSENAMGVKSSFELMQELFLSVSSNTGATVIAAAGATQFAQERAGLENGVFTYAVREYLRTTKDPTVSGLKAFVAKRVTGLTNGQQVPSTRADVLYDWSLR